jgi:hypothetical protein
VQDLLLCAKHLFVAAMLLRFTRACRESANQNMTAGQSAFGVVTFSWAAKAKRAAVITRG